MNWYLKVLSNYATFSGRANRKEYWFFVLFNILISVALQIFDTVVGFGGGFGVLSLLYTLAMLIPSLAVSVRRAHDSGRSGWHIAGCWLVMGVGYFLLIFGFVAAAATSRGDALLKASPGLTFVGLFGLLFVLASAVYLLVIMVVEGTRGDNAYGPMPSDVP